MRFNNAKALILSLIAILPSICHAESFTVKPGESINDAIKKAQEGDVILLEPGVYHQQVLVDKPKITLRGIIKKGKWPILDGRGKLADGVIASGSHFLVENIKVENYLANGITTQGASNVVIRKVEVTNTGIYGIYPSFGTNVLVEDTVSSRIVDAGIYVSQSSFVDIRRNEIYGSVAGIETENSTDVLIENNTVHNNTGGILVFALPGLKKKESKRTIVRNNLVFENNHRNFGEMGAIISTVPPGTGILLLAADEVTIENNIIRGNSLGAIVLASLDGMPGVAADPLTDPHPDNNIILHNTYIDNADRTFGQKILWLHYLSRMIWHDGLPEGADKEIFPPGGEVVNVSGGKGNCIIDKSEVRIAEKDNFSVCDSGLSQISLLTKINTPWPKKRFLPMKVSASLLRYAQVVMPSMSGLLDLHGQK